MGALYWSVPGACESQFKDVDLSGGFGLTLTAYTALANVHIFKHGDMVAL
jgi:hypothetical protein